MDYSPKPHLLNPKEYLLLQAVYEDARIQYLDSPKTVGRIEEYQEKLAIGFYKSAKRIKKLRTYVNKTDYPTRKIGKRRFY